MILSVRPWDPETPTPRGTQTRRALESAAARVRPGDDMAPLEGVSNAGGAGDAPRSRARAVPRRRRGRLARSRARSGRGRRWPGFGDDPRAVPPRNPGHARYPLGVCGNRLATLPRRGVLFGSLRRRDATGTRRRGPGVGRTVPVGDRVCGLRGHFPRPGPRSALPTQEPCQPRVTIAEWTRSRSGARRSESCRFPCRPPTSRPGFGIPASSRWMTSGSGSRFPTVSRRTGSSRGIAR